MKNNFLNQASFEKTALSTSKGYGRGQYFLFLLFNAGLNNQLLYVVRCQELPGLFRKLFFYPSII